MNGSGLDIIARIETPFAEKFGVPRQSGIADSPGRIVFEKPFRDVDAVRGLEGFSHIWLIWQFDRAQRQGWSPTVRPPRLGGNERVGVFATRSPFRPAAPVSGRPRPRVRHGLRRKERALYRAGRNGAGRWGGVKEGYMRTVTIYTDGACSGNPGPGGWGAILSYKGAEKALSGGAAQTTNNRMELTAVIEALRLLKEPCVVELYSDSKYVIDALEKGWARSWQQRGWVKSDKKPALNPDLWEQLLALTDIHEVRCHWVKGHAENEKNNRCDQMAVAESRKFQ